MNIRTVSPGYGPDIPCWEWQLCTVEAQGVLFLFFVEPWSVLHPFHFLEWRKSAGSCNNGFGSRVWLHLQIL